MTVAAVKTIVVTKATIIVVTRVTSIVVTRTTITAAADIAIDKLIFKY